MVFQAINTINVVLVHKVPPCSPSEQNHQLDPNEGLHSKTVLKPARQGTKCTRCDSPVLSYHQGVAILGPLPVAPSWSLDPIGLLCCVSAAGQEAPNAKRGLVKAL